MIFSQKAARIASLVSGLLLLVLLAAAVAQAPPHDAGVGGPAPSDANGGRALSLTPAQRLAIYQSITQTGKNSAAPVGFRATVGARVPSSVELEPLSETLAQLVPEARNLRIGMIERQVVLVDPSSRQVVAVVTQEPASAVH